MESTCGGKYYVSRIGGGIEKKFGDSFEKVCRQNENLNTEYTTPTQSNVNCMLGDNFDQIIRQNTTSITTGTEDEGKRNI